MATIRKTALVNGETYHIFNRSIAKYKIFNTDKDFLRGIKLLSYYQWEREMKFSQWIRKKKRTSETESLKGEKLVDIIAYCIMPTHFHLILKQLEDKGISTFVSQISNSYARYFNLKHKRKGHLWEKEFQNVLVSTDEQLLHLTRYIHLNPVTAFLVDKPQDWPASSYREFLGEAEESDKICSFEDILDITPEQYKTFVDDRISYQRELGKIKHLILE